MGKQVEKNTGMKVFVGVLFLALAASVTYSAVPAVKEWTDGVIEKIVVRPSEDTSSEVPSSEEPSEVPSSQEPSEEPVLAHRLELVFQTENNDQDHLLPMTFNQFTYYDSETYLFNDDAGIYMVYLNLKRAIPYGDVTFDIDGEDTTISFPFFEEDSINLALYGNVLYPDTPSERFTINGWEPGRYDFSDIDITEEGQILVPVYTPIYVQG